MATWIHIGNHADLDPTEGNSVSGNADALLGVFDNATMSFVEATGNDTSGDGIIQENDLGGGETITVDGVTAGLDSVQSYVATVTLGDGSTLTTTVGVVQLTNGETYIVPTDHTHLDNLNIQSIELTAVEKADYDGMYVTSAQRSVDNSRVVCFASGTLIETDRGEVPIETLKAGQMVRTLDRRLQSIRWIGSFAIRTTDRTCPISIGKGALGPGVPSRDLLVSPQHRIYVNSKIARRVFDCDEVLIPAKKLAGAPGIRVATEMTEVTYWHILLDRHEIIFSNGAPTESLFLGPMAREAIEEDLLDILPSSEAPPLCQSPARTFARSAAQNGFARRHAKNRKAFVRL